MKSRFKIKNVHFGHFHKNRKKDREAYLHDVKGSSCRSLSSFKMCLEAIPKLQRKKQNLKKAYFIYRLKGGMKSKRKQPKQLWQSNSITEACKSKIVIIFLLQHIKS